MANVFIGLWLLLIVLIAGAVLAYYFFPPADVVAEVHHANLEPRPHDANGAHNLAAHRVLLLAEYVLDTGAPLRERRVRRLLALGQRMIACGAPVDTALQARSPAGSPRSGPSGRRCPPIPR